MNLATRIDGPVAVIGDVHGQVDKLAAVLAKVAALPDFDQRWVVFVGDFVDRGEDSAGAIGLVLDLMEAHTRTTAIMGNHELAMCGSLGLVPVLDSAEWASRWVPHYDTDDTFRSYGAAPGELNSLSEQLPTSHQDFLAALPWVVEHPALLFVHAGLQTTQPTELQLRILRARDFTLQRPPWLCDHSLATTVVPRDCTKTVISGHVRYEEPVFADRRILIDTTGGSHGDLSCVLMPENVVITSGSAAPRKVYSSRPPAPKKPKRKGWRKVFGG